MTFKEPVVCVAVHLSHIVGDATTMYALVGQLNALLKGEAVQPLQWESPLRLTFDLFPSSLSSSDRRMFSWGILGWLVQKICGPRRTGSLHPKHQPGNF